MDLDKRIAQFEKLVEADESNDMAHFSLGGAYNQAGRYADAAASYQRCIELNPTMSKAYQLAGVAMMAAQDTAGATEVLTKGYAVAAERGDLLPMKAMGELLDQLGVDKPEVAAKGPGAPAEPTKADMTCHATGKPGSRMPRAPMRGPIGQWMHENITKQTFDEWLGLGTKIINELRLDLSNDAHNAVYDYAMRRYLRLDDATYTELTGQQPPEPDAQYSDVINQILGRMGQLEEFQGEMHRRVEG